MGYWVAAERHLSEALSFTRHPWLDRNRAVVDETLKRVQSYIGELGVTGSPSGAEVLVNEAKDEREFKLSSLARKGRKFTYEYDFGDGWVHDIVVEAVNRESNETCPPPEEPRRRDQEELKDWAGDYDPAAFDVDEVNRQLLDLFRPLKVQRSTSS